MLYKQYRTGALETREDLMFTLRLTTPQMFIDILKCLKPNYGDLNETQLV